MLGDRCEACHAPKRYDYWYNAPHQSQVSVTSPSFRSAPSDTHMVRNLERVHTILAQRIPSCMILHPRRLRYPLHYRECASIHSGVLFPQVDVHLVADISEASGAVKGCP
jgi:hypothetical protein